MHAGLPTDVYFPVKVNSPVFRSIRKDAMLSLRWLHTNRKDPARIDLYVPRIVAHGRDFAQVMQPPFAIKREDSDRIVEPIGSI